MPEYSQQVNSFDVSLPTIALAHNLRFPSPYSTHVLSSDVLSRSFSPTRPSILCTTRLILKRGKLPAWAPRGLVERGTSWVIEETEIDLESWRGGEGDGEVRTRSRNIDHKTVMQVWEWQNFKSCPEDSMTTDAFTVAQVTSEFSFWPLQRRIEKFGISRVPKSVSKARAGLALSASLLISPLTSETFLNSGPMNPYPFEPLPSSLALASELVKNRLKEARLAVKEKELRRIEEGKLLWRTRWINAAKRGGVRFRKGVCDLTGLMCDQEKDC